MAIRTNELPVATEVDDDDTVLGLVNGLDSIIPLTIIREAAQVTADVISAVPGAVLTGDTVGDQLGEADQAIVDLQGRTAVDVPANPGANMPGSNVQARLDEADAMLGVLDAGQDSAADDIAALGPVVTQNQSDIAALQPQVDANTASVGVYDTRIATNESNIAQNQVDIADAQQDITDLDDGKVDKAGDLMTGELRVEQGDLVLANPDYPGGARFRIIPKLNTQASIEVLATNGFNVLGALAFNQVADRWEVRVGPSMRLLVSDAKTQVYSDEMIVPEPISPTGAATKQFVEGITGALDGRVTQNEADIAALEAGGGASGPRPVEYVGERDDATSSPLWTTEFTGSFDSNDGNIAEHYINGAMKSWLNEWGALRGSNPYGSWSDALVRAIVYPGDTANPDHNAIEIQDRTGATVSVYGRGWTGTLHRNGLDMADTIVLADGDPVPSDLPAGSLIARLPA